MANHPNYVEKYGESLEDLAKDINHLRYDAEAKLQFEHAKQFYLEAVSEATKSPPRPKLATALMDSAISAHKSAQSTYSAWKISKPYMPDVPLHEVRDNELSILNLESTINDIKRNEILRSSSEKINSALNDCFDEEDSLKWFYETRPSSLKNKTPYRNCIEGNGNDVLRIILSIEYGIYQ